MNIRHSLDVSRSHVTTVLALSIGLALSACGGGGGGSSSFTGAVPSASGAAAKGIIKNGIVTANELDATGAILRTIGTATTDSKGDYSITLGNGYAGGPVDFKLTAGVSTVMVCDVKPNCGTIPTMVNFGSDMPVPTLSMEALVGKANSGDVLSVNITPFTTMAAARARKATALNAAAVNSANSAVSNLLGGLDVLSLKPVNLADPTATGLATSGQITYAALSAAIGKLAINSGGTIDLDAALTKLGSSFEAGSISAQTGTALTFSLKDIVDAANNQLGLEGLTDDTGVVIAMQQTISNAGGSLITPIPNPNAGSPDLVKAKALVQDIRTWGVTLNNLSNPANAFSNQITMAQAVSGPMITSVSASLATALNTLFTTMSNNNGVAGSYPYNDATGTGTVTVTPNGGTTTLIITGTVGTETVNLTATLPSIGSASISTLTLGLTGSVKTTDASKPGVSLTLNSGTSVTANFNPALTQGATPTSSSLSTGNFALDATLAQINTTNPVTFTGKISAGVQRVTSGSGATMLVDFNPTTVGLSGTVASGSNSFQTTIAATIINTNFSPFIPESATNTLNGTLTMSMTATLSGLPPATLTLTLHKTGFGDADHPVLGDANLILASAGETTTLAVSKVDLNPASGTAVFNNTNGASLTLSATSDNSTHTLMVGNASVGTVHQFSNGVIKITYSDGTFETLN